VPLSKTEVVQQAPAATTKPELDLCEPVWELGAHPEIDGGATKKHVPRAEARFLWLPLMSRLKPGFIPEATGVDPVCKADCQTDV
jgi:hypothetical protein